MFSIYVSSNYKRTLWFKNKVWSKNIKLSTKTANLIKVYTNLKKALRIGKFFKMKIKLSCAEMLRHNKFNKLINNFCSLKACIIMYSIYVSSNYKQTLWFKNKVWSLKYKIVYKNCKLL